MNLLRTLLVLTLIVAVAAGVALWSGVYNVGADDPHWSATHRALELARQRSISTSAAGIEVPDLSDAALIRSGPALTTPCASPAIPTPTLAKPS